MEIPDKLRCLFAADVEETRGTYQIAVPKRDVEFGILSAVVFSYAIASPKTAPVGMDGGALSAKSTRARLSSANQNATRSGRITKDAERLSNDSERIEPSRRGLPRPSHYFSYRFHSSLNSSPRDSRQNFKHR